ncbi:hypothetical protein PVAP13_6KG406066 [Panicum virgatum]|uniref:Uncharacterized protein n=1 Tax=Panicum virgatum TaxID=38727 RepID=A0A8T0RKP4_PANVG|nr:hypothetical protein PVAP13_6KG406066 [Panicum virgatum]
MYRARSCPHATSSSSEMLLAVRSRRPGYVRGYIRTPLSPWQPHLLITTQHKQDTRTHSLSEPGSNSCSSNGETSAGAGGHGGRAGGGAAAGRGPGAGGRDRVRRGGSGVGGGAVGAIRAVARRARGGARPGRQGPALQRLQGERAPHPRLQPAGRAVQAPPQPLRRHDRRRVPPPLRRLQGRAPPHVPRRPGRRRRVVLQVRRRARPPGLRRLAPEGRRHRRQGPGPVRELLGVLDDRRRGGHQRDRDQEPDVTVGTAAGGLRHQGQRRLQRRPHGLRVPVHRQARRGGRRGRVPVPGPAGRLQEGRRRPGSEHRRVRGRAGQRRGGAAQGGGAPAGGGGHRGQRFALPVLLGGRVRGALRHGAGPRRGGRRLRGRRRRDQVLGGQELVGPRVGGEGVHPNGPRRGRQGGALRHRHGGVLPRQDLAKPSQAPRRRRCRRRGPPRRALN